MGDGVHNFVDGVLIAAAFYTDVHLGVVTALAVAPGGATVYLGSANGGVFRSVNSGTLAWSR